MKSEEPEAITLNLAAKNLTQLFSCEKLDMRTPISSVNTLDTHIETGKMFALRG